MSSTATSKLGLFKAVINSGEPFRVSDFNSNMDKIDASSGAFICTSTTRPGAPFDGQLIKETDTKRMFVWDQGSTKWVFFGGIKPTCFVRRNSDSSIIPVTTWTPIVWAKDDGGETTDQTMWDSSHASNIVVPIDGIYRCLFQAEINQSSPGGYVYAAITRNADTGAPARFRGTSLSRATGSPGGLIATALIACSAGDTISGELYTNVASTYAKYSTSPEIGPFMQVSFETSMP